ncbi:MAG: RHS domain-containing protein, partial [Methylobacteriaceae bacterium]|nr:RHS domain-containing protein [Methylobacteriaceae bacterium]
GLWRLAKRVVTSPSSETHYLQDPDGHIIAETDGSGNTTREYIWLDDMPIAVIDGVNTPSPTTYYVHTDHLMRPIAMTDKNATIVWSAVYKPFGEVLSITGTPVMNARFPGQWFQLETGLHYNWHRHYDPTLGRYLQPDPLGFVSGSNVYSYVRQNPLRATDRFGLQMAEPEEVEPDPKEEETARERDIWSEMNEAGREESNRRKGAFCPVPPSAAKPAAPWTPDFIVTSGGDIAPVPGGATGPFPTNNPGFQFNGGAGGNGLAPNVTDLRIMDPNARNPTGYANYGSAQANGGWQSVNPYTGQSIAPSSPWWHIPINTGR